MGTRHLRGRGHCRGSARPDLESQTQPGSQAVVRGLLEITASLGPVSIDHTRPGAIFGRQASTDAANPSDIQSTLYPFQTVWVLLNEGVPRTNFDRMVSLATTRATLHAVKRGCVGGTGMGVWPDPLVSMPPATIDRPAATALEMPDTPTADGTFGSRLCAQWVVLHPNGLTHGAWNLATSTMRPMSDPFGLGI